MTLSYRSSTFYRFRCHYPIITYLSHNLHKWKNNNIYLLVLELGLIRAYPFISLPLYQRLKSTDIKTILNILPNSVAFSEIINFKVLMFWEGHENLKKSPNFIWRCIRNSKKVRRFEKKFLLGVKSLDWSSWKCKVESSKCSLPENQSWNLQKWAGK